MGRSLRRRLLLVEWAERARELFSGDRLDIRLSFAEPERRDARMIMISVTAPLRRAWRRSSPCTNFCAKRTGGTRRDFLQGDASSRAYETLTKPTGEKAILMMSPQRPMVHRSIREILQHDRPLG